MSCQRLRIDMVDKDNLPQGHYTGHSPPLWPDASEKEQYERDLKVEKPDAATLHRIARYEFLYTTKRDSK